MSPSLTDNVHANGTAERPTLAHLLGELTGQMVTLGKQEIALAKAEIKQSARATARDSAGIFAGAVLLHAGMFALLAALVVGLATVMPLWGSLLLIGALTLLCGGVVVKQAMNKLQKDTHLEHLPKSLERNREFLKEKMA